jgi:hypothetical protein
MVTLSNVAKTEHAKRSTSGKGNGGTYIAANSVRDTDAESYVKFIHASLGFPAPTIFLKAVTRGYITGPNQFPRLTPKMARRYMPNAIATARSHLDKTNAAQSHDLSEAVSARKRHHLRVLTAKRKATDKNQGKHAPFSHTAVPKSTTLHLDYTGPLPEPCASEIVRVPVEALVCRDVGIVFVGMLDTQRHLNLQEAFVQVDGRAVGM